MLLRVIIAIYNLNIPDTQIHCVGELQNCLLRRVVITAGLLMVQLLVCSKNAAPDLGLRSANP